MGNRTSRPAGKNDTPITCCALPAKIRGDELAISADATIDLIGSLSNGFIEIPVGTHTINPKTGERSINGNNTQARKRQAGSGREQ